MSILRDIYCPDCQTLVEDVFVDGDEYPTCGKCSVQMRNAITKINADIWGGPQYHPALDMTFASKSDLKAHMKSRNLVEAGDKVGGSRNEDYLGLGKRFSYEGKKNRSGTDYAETRKYRAPAPTRGS